MDPKIIALYDDFTHRHLDRRVFLERLTKLVGSSALALTLMSALQSDYANAAMVAEDDSRLSTAGVVIPGAAGAVKGYVARPVGSAKLAGIIVIHENRGLTPHIRDVARRAALAGFVALAPDCMSAIGGTPDDEDQALNAFPKLAPDTAVAELLQCVAYMTARPDATGKLGAVGFCWGGGMVNRLAEASPQLAACVAFYGVAPPLDQVAKIKAKLMMHYAGLDDRVNATRPGYEEALKQAGVSYTMYVYPDVNHAFHNDTGGARYNEAAAKLAWQRSVDFFHQTLG